MVPARPVGADIADPQAEDALVGGVGDDDEVVLAEAEAAGGGPLVEDADDLEALAADANQLADRIDAVRLEQQLCTRCCRERPRCGGTGARCR